MAMWNDYEKLARRLDRIANAFERIADALEADRKDEPTGYNLKPVEDEPQTENLFTDKYGDVWEWRGDAWYCISEQDEPQTDCAWR